MARFKGLTVLVLVTTGVAAPVAAQELVFTLANNSGVDLVELYASRPRPRKLGREHSERVAFCLRAAAVR